MLLEEKSFWVAFLVQREAAHSLIVVVVMAE